MSRCFGEGDPLYERYHDTEWGWPQHDETRLYEKLCLEALQSGLSWILILRRRDGLRQVSTASTRSVSPTSASATSSASCRTSG